MTVQQLNDKYLGKRISVPWQRKGFGSDIDRVTGICDFIGYNDYFPEWGLQVTINRMPITNVNPETIKLIEDGRKINAPTNGGDGGGDDSSSKETPEEANPIH